MPVRSFIIEQLQRVESRERDDTAARAFLSDFQMLTWSVAADTGKVMSAVCLSCHFDEKLKSFVCSTGVGVSLSDDQYGGDCLPRFSLSRPKLAIHFDGAHTIDVEVEKVGQDI